MLGGAKLGSYQHCHVSSISAFVDTVDDLDVLVRDGLPCMPCQHKSIRAQWRVIYTLFPLQLYDGDFILPRPITTECSKWYLYCLLSMYLDYYFRQNAARYTYILMPTFGRFHQQWQALYRSEWVISVLSSMLTLFRSYRDWNKVYQAQWLGLRTRLCLYVLVCMYWTRLVLVQPAASSYSASPLKHHATGRQWCPNPDPYPDSEPASWSLIPLCWALSRAAELQILTSFVWRGWGSNHQPPACQANAIALLHCPAAVKRSRTFP